MRARAQQKPDALALARLAEGRSRQGDADGGRHSNGATAPRPPLCLAEPPESPAGERHLQDARAELERLDRAYHAALERCRDARVADAIAAAFDESDALQRRILSGLHRLRQLENELADAAASSDQPPAPAAAHTSPTAPPDNAA